MLLKSRAQKVPVKIMGYGYGVFIFHLKCRSLGAYLRMIYGTLLAASQK